MHSIATAHRTSARRIAGRPGFFAMLGVALVAGVLADVGHLLAQAAPAQAPASLPSFDVASIKPNSSNDGRVQILGRPGQFAANNVTVQLLVQQAFRIQNFQIVGAPAWLSTDRFDVNAKIPADGGQQNEMLQSLLIDRMRLKFHRETREMPVYALVLARTDGRLGPNLKKSDVDCSAPRGGGPGRGAAPGPDGPPPGGARQAGPGALPGGLQCGARFGLGQFNASGMPIDQLATNLSRSLNRVVIDRTGLAGGFDVDLTWTPDPGQGAGPLGALPPQLGPGGPPAPAPDGPSIFTAVQEQLGLKLDSQRGPVEVLVIDSIEKPTPD